MNELKALKEDKSRNYVFVFDSIFRKPELIYPMIDVIQEGFQVVFVMNSDTEDYKNTLETKLGEVKTNLITGSNFRMMSHVHVAQLEEIK